MTTYDITRAFYAGAFEPTAFYEVTSLGMTAGQGAVSTSTITAVVLLGQAAAAGLGTPAFTISLALIGFGLTAARGAPVPTVQFSPVGWSIGSGLGAITPWLLDHTLFAGYGSFNLGDGSVRLYTSDFFTGASDELYVPPEENVLYVLDDGTNLGVEG